MAIASNLACCEHKNKFTFLFHLTLGKTANKQVDFQKCQSLAVTVLLLVDRLINYCIV